MKKVLSFGELLLRICPDTAGEWLQQNNLPVYVGGAEANVATALALWGVPSAYFSVLPENLLSQQLMHFLQQLNIDTSRVIQQGERIGLYFLPKGKDLKNAGVIYDRNHSSFSALRPGSVDWDKVLEGVSWLHFSAISPALNAGVAAVCEEGLQAAAQKKITISVDLNYRAKLWQYGKHPAEIMPGLVQYCDVVMGNLWAAEKMLAIPVDSGISGNSKKEDYLQQARVTSEGIRERFPKVSKIANTFRFDQGVEGIHYYTTLFADRKLYTSREYFSDKIVDKVGSGDCFMGGLIYGFYRERPIQEILEFATAAAFRKLFIPSDATNDTVEQIPGFIREKELVS